MSSVKNAARARLLKSPCFSTPMPVQMIDDDDDDDNDDGGLVKDTEEGDDGGSEEEREEDKEAREKAKNQGREERRSFSYLHSDPATRKNFFVTEL